MSIKMTPNKKLDAILKLKQIKVINFGEYLSDETIERLKEIDNNIRQAYINRDKFYCD